MIRYFISLVVAVATALMMWGCSAEILDGECQDPGNGATSPGEGNPGEGDPGEGDPGPTTPIKRRPIVPSTKLPRPRVIERVIWTGVHTLSVELKECVLSAEVIVRDATTGEEHGYLFAGDRIEIAAPERSFEIEVRVGDEHYTYTIEAE